jgi:uncharacterized membrane protein SpoIIM required for sporulation
MYKAIKIAICMACWLIGLAVSSLMNFNTLEITKGNHSIYASMSYFEIFYFLFKTNSIVGLLCCYLGYISGGFVTLFILLFNGYIFGMSFFPILPLQPSGWIENHLLLQLLGHVPFEIISFSLFGAVGLGGFDWVLNLYRDNEIAFKLPHPRTLIAPFLILLFATTLESYAIYR